ncbi:hypothetical protein DFH29DRAFT_1039075 [Suillus ampliporus]|nr:hypothetical protein DFH29DRAFT_1039075 [Suillus ampliporus]
MTKWLARQEAVGQFDAYLDWTLKRLDSVHNEADDDGGDAEIEGFDAEAQPKQTTTADSIPVVTHILASRPSFQALTVPFITQTFGGLSFLPAVSLYLRVSSLCVPAMSHSAAPELSQWDRFDAYRRLSIPYLKLRALHMGKTMDRIRATPSMLRWGVHKARLVDLTRYLSEQKARSMFIHKGLRLKVYKWRRSDSYSTSHHTCALLANHFISHSLSGSNHSVGQAPRAEVIPITRIVGSCHLIPKFGTHADPTWRADEVLDVCKTFYSAHVILGDNERGWSLTVGLDRWLQWNWTWDRRLRTRNHVGGCEVAEKQWELAWGRILQALLDYLQWNPPVEFSFGPVDTQSPGTANADCRTGQWVHDGFFCVAYRLLLLVGEYMFSLSAHSGIFGTKIDLFVNVVAVLRKHIPFAIQMTVTVDKSSEDRDWDCKKI